MPSKSVSCIITLPTTLALSTGNIILLSFYKFSHQGNKTPNTCSKAAIFKKKLFKLI